MKIDFAFILLQEASIDKPHEWADVFGPGSCPGRERLG
jgi:hypothetical protein